jgi:hypothetical protein
MLGIRGCSIGVAATVVFLFGASELSADCRKCREVFKTVGYTPEGYPIRLEHHHFTQQEGNTACGYTSSCHGYDDPGPCHVSCNGDDDDLPEPEFAALLARLDAAVFNKDAAEVRELIARTKRIRFDPQVMAIEVASDCDADATAQQIPISSEFGAQVERTLAGE